VARMKQLEIERKYLIRMPDDILLSALPSSRIEQIYILSADGARERIRRRIYPDRTVCTHTIKKRLSDLSRIENEEEIGEDRYAELLLRSDPKRKPIRKTRYLYRFKGQVFEIDCFPFWDDRALMEIEMEAEDQQVCLPPDIEIIREVTREKQYTNSAIACEIPREELP
jgi:CYTH domain-containing protein